MLFERLVLSAWGKYTKADDPFHLGSADVLSMVDNDLSGQNGHDVKFGLSTALRKIAAENEEVCERLMGLDKELWAAKLYNDVVVILTKTKDIFNSLDMHIP